MRTIIKKFNVYQYSELSEKAKEKVRFWYIDDPFRSEQLTDMINEDLENLFPNSKLKVQWSLCNCQGDGVNIYGDLDVMDLINLIQNHICGDTYKKYENFFSAKEIKTIKSYSGYCGDVDLPSNRRYSYCCVDMIDLADDWFDILLNEYYFRNINCNLLHKLEKFVIDIIEEYCRDWETVGDKYLYEPEEDEIEEICEANEWEFLEDGTYYAA